ncbi:UNVERIFIED_CONTAM: hypothetical protein FKN15_042238 [Acipenser sinensis]
MSTSRQQHQNGGGVGSGPGTSSSNSGGNTSNGDGSGNAVSSRTLGTGIGALAVPILGVPSSRSSAVSLGRPGSSSGSSSRKRTLPTPLCNGLINSYEDKSNDFVCPVCFEMIEEAHMTKCGHMNELILKQKQRLDEKRLKLDHPNGHRWQVFQDVLGTDQENLDLANVNFMLELLVQKKKQLEAESQAAQLQILMEFLKEARRNKREQLEQLQKELNFLEEDIKHESRTANQLDDFMECLSKFTRYNSVRPLATLSYASDLYNGSSIVSSIEFDRDCDYFAIAGVTKKIKVFEYGTVIQDAVDIHYPVNEMTCNSKISCISWSSYHKNLLASSDYEGTVILWDGFTGQRSKVYQEHEKRCWSVDFNLMDPKLLASGSDDAKVKLWSTNLDNSVASIEAKANVCCVKFSPTSRYHLAFGCADHCVHYYDLRNTKQPIMVFKGHRKAVSYAKFVNGEEIVSASTDSQLKLWNVNKPHCLRSFKGHINEKNFVGLASNGDYVACGMFVLSVSKDVFFPEIVSFEM